MLHSPHHAVVGCPDIDAAAAFYGELGFIERHRSTLTAAAASDLYGLSAASDQVLLGQPNAAHGGIVLVHTIVPALPEQPLSAGGFAVDVYTRDIDADLRRLAPRGGRVTGRTAWELGGVPFEECRVVADSGAVVVLIDTPRRRASLLDTVTGAAHSEIQAMVYLTNEMDSAFWKAAGLQVMRTERLVDPLVAGLIGVPDSDAEIRLDLYWDGSGARLELIGFAGLAERPGARHELRPGPHAAVFVTPDMPAAVELLTDAGARVGPVVADPLRGAARAVTAPDGIGFELWSRAAATVQ